MTANTQVYPIHEFRNKGEIRITRCMRERVEKSKAERLAWGDMPEKGDSAGSGNRRHRSSRKGAT